MSASANKSELNLNTSVDMYHGNNINMSQLNLNDVRQGDQTISNIGESQLPSGTRANDTPSQ